MQFDDLSEGQRFRLSQGSTTVYTRRGDYAIGATDRLMYGNEQVYVVNEKQMESIRRRRANSKARNDAMRSLNMKKTPYGWE